MRKRETDRLRRAAAYLGAWLPYGTLWFLLGLYGGSAPSVAALLGLVRFASAASLGLAIHWLCGRLPWPERARGRFAAAHVGAALAFGWAILGANVATFALYEGRPVGIDLPLTVEMTVMETEPAIKGASVSNVGKPAKMETGLIVQVPAFISEGERIRIDTSSGAYIERVK